MTSLRMRVVEAGARALAVAFDKGEQYAVDWEDDASVALDAMLDCLTEEYPRIDEVNGLLEALREDR